MQLLIEVTAEDIAKGEQKACRHCPIALALKRTTGLSFNVRSNHISYNSYIPHISLPDAAKRFIASFDIYGSRGIWAKPFSFTLDVPKEMIKECCAD